MAHFLAGLVLYNALSSSHASTVLDTTYGANFVLNQAGSPYYLNHNVLFDQNVTIHEGVEVIFNGNYQMEIRGYLDACTNPTVVDTSIRGLTNPATAISIRGDTGRIGFMYLTVGNGASGTICNTKFSSLNYALSVTCCYNVPENRVTIDNAEFEDIAVIFNGYSGTDVAVSHSSFNNFGFVTSRADKLFYNCIFTNFDSVLASGTSRVSMYDSEVIGTGTETCLSGSGGIKRVKVTNCNVAIQSNGFSLYFNNISNSNVGLNTGTSGTATVYGNNFINNGINVQSPGSTDQGTLSTNYWGTTDESQIASKIEDICSGFSTALVTWWPYAIQQIDFDTDVTNDVVDANILSDLQTTLQCGSSSDPSTLNSIYLSNTVLTVANSPYYVRSGVIVRETMTIEAGVEIIFTGSWVLEVRGVLNACPDPTTAANTLTRGIYDVANAITIRSNNSVAPYGYIRIDTADGATAAFCNTYFKDIAYALSVTCCYNVQENRVTIDNAEFENIAVVFDSYSGTDVAVNDSVFNNFGYVTSRADKLFYNCVFTNFDSVLASGTSRVSMYDSEVIGTGTETCLSGSGGIKRVKVTNCNIAIQSNGFTLYFNNISNSNVGLITGTSSSTTVYGNNFINNNINVQAPGSTDQDTLSTNYWGTTDESQIAAKIEDICDLYSTALVTWWPYVTREIDSNTDVVADVVDTSIIRGLQSPFECNPFESVSALSPLYLSDVTLTVANSPYYIKSDVVVKSTMTIEAGVELIFTGSWVMEVRNVLNACPDPTTAANTVTRGVYDVANAITIRSNNSVAPYGYIRIDTADGATASFCNTYFKDIAYALSVTCCYNVQENRVTIDNAEFENIAVIFDSYSGTDVAVNDSVFNNFGYVTSRADKLFYNCVFTNFDSVLASGTSRVAMYDSEVIGTGTESCVSGSGSIKRVKVTNCNVAIQSNGFTLYFNEISNSNVGLNTGTNGVTTAYGNNFIGNTINVEAPGVTNQDKLCGNYWGTVDTAVIQNKITDAYDGYSTSIVTWNPFLMREVDFDMDLISNGQTFIVPPSLFSDTTPCGATLSPTTPFPTTKMPTGSPITVSPTTAVPTNDPTTAFPTTIAPTTALPTTAAPTTGLPTTVSPTTGLPTTAAPTAILPTTAAPTAVLPTTAAPTAVLPTTAAPTAILPTTTAPTAVLPTTTAPSAALPTTAAPTTAAPTTASPTTDPTTLVPTYSPTTFAPTSSPSVPCDALPAVEFDDPCSPDPGDGCGVMIQLDATVCVINGVMTRWRLEKSITRAAKRVINGLNKVDVQCTEEKIYLKDVQVTPSREEDADVAKANGLHKPQSLSECPKVDELCGDEGNDEPQFDVDIVVAIRCDLSCDGLRDVAVQLLSLVEDGSLDGTFSADWLDESVNWDKVCNIGLGRVSIDDEITVTLVDEQNNILAIHNVDITENKCERPTWFGCILVVLAVLSLLS